MRLQGSIYLYQRAITTLQQPEKFLGDQFCTEVRVWLIAHSTELGTTSNKDR